MRCRIEGFSVAAVDRIGWGRRGVRVLCWGKGWKDDGGYVRRMVGFRHTFIT